MSTPLQRTCLAIALATPACCVAATTRVRTPRGHRPAAALEIGDQVLSLDVTTGQLSTTTIVAIRRAARECLALHHAGGTLVCTPDHPIYCPESGTYRPASDWITGDARTLLHITADSRRPITVTSSDAFAGVHEVLDLTLDAEPHNFLAADILVHNKSPVEYYANGSADGPTFVLGVGDEVQYRVKICTDDQAEDFAEVHVHVVADETVEPAESFLKLSTSVDGSNDIKGVPAERDINTLAPADCDDGFLVTFKASHNYFKSTDGELTGSFSIDANIQVDDESDEADPVLIKIEKL